MKFSDFLKLEEQKENVNDIVKIVEKGDHYIFSSFNDSRISKVEDILDKKNIEFITTSQTGKDHVIAGENSHFYKKFKRK
jgi:hypothetical protein